MNADGMNADGDAMCSGLRQPALGSRDGGRRTHVHTRLRPLRRASAGSGFGRRWAAVLLPSFWLLAAAISAQPPDGASVAAGMRIYLQKGDCQACHGWAADGRKMDSQMPDGANLRMTSLDRDGLIEVIRCGRPGLGMPAFDRLAYKDGRCGMTEADLKRLGLTLYDPAATLQPREIDHLVDFLFAKVIGKASMDRAACIEYWGSDVEACAEFPR